MNKVINIEPSGNLIEVLGHTGYTFESAIADLIDNSISANATEIGIILDYKAKNPNLIVVDNGKGMSLDKLKEAATIGYQAITEERLVSDLGRYSTGLKSATKFLGNNLIVASKVDGNLNAINIDYDKLIKTNKWEALILGDFPLGEMINKNGTLVYCDNLINNYSNENLTYDLLTNLCESLGHIFYKYLEDNKIKIYVKTKNSQKNYVKPWNPFKLLVKTDVKTIYNGSIEYKKEKINIKTYIFPPYNNLNAEDQNYMKGRGLMEQEGFYVYRNNRLIQEGGWLNLPKLKLDDKCKYCRIELNIPSSLDEEFSVNFSKTKIEVPLELQERLLKIAKIGRQESIKTFNYKKGIKIRRVIKGKKETVWQCKNSSGGMEISINDKHSLIEEFTQEMSYSNKKKLFNLLSKSLPINMIQCQSISPKVYTQDELLNMMDELYSKFRKENISHDEAIKKISSMEPFNSCDDDLFITFIVKLKEE